MKEKMKKKINDHWKLRSKSINYINLHFLLNLMFLFSFFSFSKKHVRIMPNYNSEIYLTINGNGNQNVLSSSFYIDPSDVIVNGVSKKGVCNKICELEDDVNSITLVFEEDITTCENMFNGLSNIKEINLSNFDTSKVTSMESMFDSCINLEKIIFGNINTSSVNNMIRVFASCQSLKSVDLSNFDTSEVLSMSEMFSRCGSLRIIDASSFRTPKVQNLVDIFAYCKQLITVNVSNFDTSNVVLFQGMFYACDNLRFVDLSNFNISSGTHLLFIFSKCPSLIYLNLNSFKLTSPPPSYSPFTEYNPNVKLCMEDSYTKSLLFAEGIISICSDTCFEENIKVDITINQCVRRCDESKFEYKRVCDHLCIQGDSVFYNEDRVCFEEAPENYYLNSSDGIYRECFNKCRSCQIQEMKQITIVIYV